jgi:hypothetical protein
LTGLYGDGYSRETLADTLTATASRLKTAAENFDAKIKAQAKQLEQQSVEARAADILSI